MEAVRTHKIRFKKVNNKQASLLRQAYGTRRFVYNQTKALSDQVYKTSGKGLGKLALRNLVVQQVKKKSENSWLYDFPKSILEEAVFDYHQSMQMFFKRGHGMPGFLRRVEDRGSFSLNNAQFKVEGEYLTITKLGVFRLTESLRFDGRILNATVSQKGKHHYVAISVATEHDPLPQTGNVVGIDLNIHSIDDSDGNQFHHFQYLKSDLARLRKAQKRLSRTKKGSKNRQKARRDVARIHEAVTNRRNDSHHKLSHELVKNNSVIALEDLNVSGMLKNRKLARSLADASFSSLITKIKYKSDLNYRTVIQVGRFFPSSKMCSQCKTKKANLSLADRVFICDGCGYTERRDLNAAINIRNEGIRLLNDQSPGLGECVEDSSDIPRDAEPMKHESIINLERIE